VTYTGSYSILCRSAGTLTEIAAEGAVVHRGEKLYEVDGVPAFLFYGDRPEWRTLQSGVSDGSDIYQLDQNLIALGYTRGGFTSGDTFTSADADAVKRWQKATGQEQTGVVTSGSVIYLPGSVRVGKHQLEPGANVGPGADLAAATSTTRIVDVNLDTSKEAEVKAGDAVTIQLPSGTTANGTVASIGTVATTSAQSNNTTIDVTVSVTDQAALGNLNSAPVQVSIITAQAQNVLAVPVAALLVQADGSYAVDVVSGATTHRVRVTTGLFTDTDTLVEVTGDLNADDTVVVAQS
jgi:peptidoglycan hydrolase-like protein with peptidoglycan-binding domain